MKSTDAGSTSEPAGSRGERPAPAVEGTLQQATRRGIWFDWRVIAGLAFSAIFTWLALRDVPFAELAVVLRSMNPSLLLPAIGLTCLVMWLRALRWRLLLLEVGKTSRKDAFDSSVVGYMVNYVIPIRIGELVRAYLAATQGGFSRSAAFATVVIERVVDVFCILLVFVAVSFAIDVSHVGAQLRAGIRASALGFMLVGFVVTVGLWFVRRYRVLLQSLAARWHPIIRRHAWRIGVFASGVVFPKSARARWWFAGQTIVIWLATVAQVQILLDGFYLSLPWEASWLILVGLAVGVSLPSAPGLIGTFHYAVILVLRGFGVGAGDALSYAIMLHLVSVLPILGLGILIVWRRGLSFEKLLQIRYPGPEVP